MNEDDRLRDMLAKLSEQPTGDDNQGRELHVTGSGGWLGVILDEIDETILARKLTFEIDPGNTVEFEVSNRRLHCLSALSGKTAEPPHIDLVGQALSDGDDRLVQNIGAALQAFTSEPDQMWVKSSALGRELDPSELGVSTRALGKAWSLDHYRSPAIPPAELMQDLLGACAKIAVAVVEIKDASVIDKKGDGAGVEQLLDLAAQDRSNLRAKLDRCFSGQQAPAGMLIGGNQQSPNAVVFAFAGAHEALLLVPADKIRDIHLAWRGINQT